MRARTLGVIALVLVLGACATIPPSQDDAKVLELIDLFNQSTATAIVDQTSLPFLFQGEVLYATADVEAVLGRLKSNGLSLTTQIVGVSDSVSVGADARFATTVFGDELPDDAREVLVPSTAGTLSLIVGGEANGLPLLMGIQRRES